MPYAYVKTLKVGQLAEGENPYGVTRIDRDNPTDHTNEDGSIEVMTALEHYLKCGYIEATEEEWNAQFPKEEAINDEGGADDESVQKTEENGQVDEDVSNAGTDEPVDESKNEANQ